MEASTQSQIYSFLTTLYGGIIIGFIYDIYRIIRYYSKSNKVGNFIKDILFWIVFSAIIISVFMYTNWGEFRGYIVIGIIIGAILYNRLLSKKVIKIVVSTLSFFIGKTKAFIRFMILPFEKLKTFIRERYNKIRRYFKLPSIIYDNIKKNIRTIIKKK